MGWRAMWQGTCEISWNICHTGRVFMRQDKIWENVMMYRRAGWTFHLALLLLAVSWQAAANWLPYEQLSANHVCTPQITLPMQNGNDIGAYTAASTSLLWHRLVLQSVYIHSMIWSKGKVKYFGLCRILLSYYVDLACGMSWFCNVECITFKYFINRCSYTRTQ